MSFIHFDRKWGQPDFGTASGVVTWEVTSLNGLSFDAAQYSINDFDNALSNAFQIWEDAADIDFELATASGSADISLSMSALPGPTIGRASTSFYILQGTDQMLSAEIELDSLEDWAPYGETALNFFAVALHEIGHTLGLDHVSDPNQIMNAVISSSALGTGDISGVRYIYGARPNGEPSDVLVGGLGTDYFYGLGGNDTLMGGGGNDILVGGTGTDNIQGEDGDDLLVGEDSSLRDSYAGQVFRLYGVVLGREPNGSGHDNWTNQLAEGKPLNKVAAKLMASAEFKLVYGAMDNATFIETLFLNALGREPNPDGFASWTSALDNGLSRRAAVIGFSESNEYVGRTEAASTAFTTAARQRDYTDDVYRLYDGLLDRAPNAKGLHSWSERLVSGTELSKVVTSFMKSSEYRSSFGGLGNKDFVAQLYQTALDRVGSASEVGAWASLLAKGMSRKKIVMAFIDSAEAQAKSLPKIDAYFHSESSAELNDILDGGAGDDLLVGGLGADTFVFDAAATGSDVVADLDPWDILLFDGYTFADLSEVPELLRQEGDDVIFESSGQTITFLDTQLSDFA